MQQRTTRVGAVGGMITALVAGAALVAPAAIAGTPPPPPIYAQAHDIAVPVGASAYPLVATRGAPPSVAGTACAACDLRHGPLELPEPEPEPELYAWSSKHTIRLSGMHFSTESYARVKLDIWTYGLPRRHMFNGQVDNDSSTILLKNGTFTIDTDVRTCYGDPDAYAVARDDVTGYVADPVPVRVGPC